MRFPSADNYPRGRRGAGKMEDNRGNQMAFELKPGDACRLSRNLAVDGKQVFERGDEVEVLDIDPDPERPGFKYVVFSGALGSNVKVRGSDLDRGFCGDCGEPLIQTAYECPKCGWVVPGREDQWRETDLARFRNRKYENSDRHGVPMPPWL